MNGNQRHIFAGRTLCIATKHAKEKVIAPVLEAELGVKCVVSDGLDTDLLGTFAGEVERKLDPLATAREKCARALDFMNCDLAVASEGSFGPHPSMPFIPGDDELLVLVDRRNGLELVAREISAETNFDSAEISSRSELLAFAKKAGFPEHALILRPSRENSDGIHKGIRKQRALVDIHSDMAARTGVVFVETDMRAMYNPMRMAVIQAVTGKLAALAKSSCPTCSMPGFTVTEVIRGLPCEICGLPTNSASRLVSECNHCSFKREQRNPDGKEREDAMYCGFCNP